MEKQKLWSYDWDGYGMEIEGPNGFSVYLQGDEASDLYDALDQCETEDQQQIILDQYSVLLEG